tara:strand:+ start:586 stop:798 length:213 start_codon:yes stop_codon:yes gene_type:complete
MIIEVKDNTDQLHYLNTAYVVYIRQRPNHGLWKIVLANEEHILTASTIAVKQIIDSFNKDEKDLQELVCA